MISTDPARNDPRTSAFPRAARRAPRPARRRLAWLPAVAALLCVAGRADEPSGAAAPQLQPAVQAQPQPAVQAQPPAQSQAQTAAPAQPAAAAESTPAVARPPADRPRVRITDPYIELHTGPGRGYPVFHVVQRGDWIELRSRHTDWYRVRTDAGKEGWVDRAQLATTLDEAGEHTSFRDIVLDDYLHRRAELGGAWGHFSGSSMFKLWGTYNLNDTFALELAAGQVQGLYSGTSFWQLDVVAEPWADRRLSPFFGIGVGKIDNVPSASLVSAISNNAKLADAMVGVRYHVTDRLVARADWTEYTAFISSGRTSQYHALAVGLAFFF